jgi:hypothetical protein
MNIKTVMVALILTTFASGCLSPQRQVKPVPIALLPNVGIAGQVTASHGEPTTGVYIYAYRNMRSNLRGPADFEAQVDKYGRYFLDLVEGDYYLVARMRQSGADAGPPKPGDAWALPATNPTTVIPGEVTTVNLVLQGIAQPMLMREGTLTSGDTGFTGLLIDAEGQPLTGAFVIAYPEADFQRMPSATSPAVGADGRFHLYVERTGQWCLAARTRTRGQPITGEPYGLLNIKESGCLNTMSGQVIDIGTIQLTPYRQR